MLSHLVWMEYHQLRDPCEISVQMEMDGMFDVEFYF